VSDELVEGAVLARSRHLTAGGWPGSRSSLRVTQSMSVNGPLTPK
jgi:hypothetical protein